jgi:hypothetical protein
MHASHPTAGGTAIAGARTAPRSSKPLGGVNTATAIGTAPSGSSDVHSPNRGKSATTTANGGAGGQTGRNSQVPVRADHAGIRHARQSPSPPTRGAGRSPRFGTSHRSSSVNAHSPASEGLRTTVTESADANEIARSVWTTFRRAGSLFHSSHAKALLNAAIQIAGSSLRTGEILLRGQLRLFYDRTTELAFAGGPFGVSLGGLAAILAVIWAGYGLYPDYFPGPDGIRPRSASSLPITRPD